MRKATIIPSAYLNPEATAIITSDASNIFIRSRPLYSDPLLIRRRLTPGDPGYIDCSTMGVKEIVENLSVRSCNGARVLEPDLIAGGTAFKWEGYSSLTTTEARGCPLVVGVRDGSKHADTAKKYYARAADRLGFMRDVRPGRVSLQSLKVEEGATYPPFRSSLGSALMARRNLISSLETLNFSSAGLKKITTVDWGLLEDDSDLLDGVRTFRDNPLRVIAATDIRFYASRTMIEVTKGLFVRRIPTARDSLARGEDYSLNHAALDVLAQSVVALVMRRNPEAAHVWSSYAHTKSLGLSYTADALGHVAYPSDLGRVLDEFAMPLVHDEKSAMQERAGFIRSWQMCIKNVNADFAAREASDREDRLDNKKGDALLAVTQRIDRAGQLLRKKSHAGETYGVISTAKVRSHLRADLRAADLNVSSIRASAPISRGSPVSSAIRLILFSSAQFNVVGVTRALRNLVRMGFKEYTFRDKAPFYDLIPDNIETEVRRLLFAKGIPNVDELISKFKFPGYRANMSLKNAMISMIDNADNPRLSLWLAMTVRNMARAQELLMHSEFALFSSSSILDCSLNYINKKLTKWTADLQAPTRYERDYILKLGQNDLAPDGSMFYSRDELLAHDTIRNHASSEYEWIFSDIISQIDLITRPINSHRTLPYYRFLAYRQVIVMMFQSCHTYTHGEEVGIMMSKKQLLSRLIQGMTKRKDNLRRRYAAHRGNPEAFFPNDYSPDACMIDLEFLAECTTLDDFFAWETTLPFGYFLVSSSEALGAVSKRLSLIMADLTGELNKVGEYISLTLEAVEQNNEVPIAMTATTKPIFRDAQRNQEVALVHPSTEEEDQETLSLLGTLAAEPGGVLEAAGEPASYGFCMNDLATDTRLVTRHGFALVSEIIASTCVAYNIDPAAHLDEVAVSRMGVNGSDVRKSVCAKLDRSCLTQQGYWK